MSPAPLLELGYVSGVHGLAGELTVKTYDPASEALFEVDRLCVRTRAGDERELSISEVRSTPKGLLLRLRGVTSREAAQQLVGSKVFVLREDLPPPGDDELFQGDLVGLLAEDEQGRALGKVEELWATGEVPTLVIRGQGKELLVPFVEPFVAEVDVEKGRLVIRPPEYSE